MDIPDPPNNDRFWWKSAHHFDDRADCVAALNFIAVHFA
jgi:hypothetical protein